MPLDYTGVGAAQFDEPATLVWGTPIPVTTDTVLELTLRVARIEGADASIAAGLICYNDAGAQTSQLLTMTSVVSGSDWVDITESYSSWPSGTTSVIMVFQHQTTGSTIHVDQFFHEDVTAVIAAEAAVVSSNSASASATEAGEYAEASQSERILAETARSGAEAALESAVTSETNAAGSAATSATHATNAANSANEAGDYATAASSSASVASTKADEASQEATAANNAKLAAETARSGAETAETNAATSATDADGSAATATSQATNAANSANEAGDQATAAANSASAASTKADEASQSAMTATTQANTATTKAGEASTSATQAASSKTDAEGSASEASTHATNAANSANIAGDEATAAANSASTATTKASEAETFASSASTSANTATTKASEASSSATTAVSASDTATGASATAISARDTAVAVSSQGGGVLSDMMMPFGSGKWTTWQEAPVVSPNEIYPTGNTFSWDVTTQNAGALLVSGEALWTGPHFADGFRVEVEFEIVSGATSGAGFLFDMYDASGSHERVTLKLEDMVEGPIGTGLIMKGSALAMKTPAHPRTPNYNRVYLMANFAELGANSAKHIKVHSVQFYPVTKGEASVQTLESAVVDLEGNAAAALSFRAIAGTAGAELELAAFDDMTGAASLARIAADNVILEGSVTIDHLASTVLTADNITAGTMSVNRIVVDEILEIDAVNAGFAMGKNNPYDLSTDGLYMGRTDEDGSTGFGFAMSYDNGTATESIQATSQTGLKINNAKFFRDLSPTPSVTEVTSDQTFTLPIGSELLNLNLIGGGGGGYSGDHDNDGQDGGDTTVQLLDGSTTIATWTASGGLGGKDWNRNVFNSIRKYGQSGQSSTWGSGGAGGDAAYTYSTGGGKAGNGTGTVQETPGGNATGYGAGGGGGGGDDRGGEGGKAGQFISVVDYDISSLANPKLVITVGAKGYGADGSADGGNGSPGKANFQTISTRAFPADVIPLTPTATGTMSNQGPFPDLGAGFWIISAPTNHNDVGIGLVELNDLGVTHIAVYGGTTSFISAKTPVRSGTQYSARTLNYQFHKMGA